MATENIGSKYNTQIPSLTENADIQTALKIYHYGQSTEPSTLVSNSVAGHLQTLEDTKIDIVPIQIVAGAQNDLDLKITSGYYSISTNAIASAGLHYPSSATAGMLSVINDGSGLVYQTYLMTGGSNKFYWRGFYSGAWTAWAQASDTTHSHSEFASLQGQIDLKAPLASPSLTGTPLSTTAAIDTSTTQIATTAFVTNQAAAATSPMDGVAAVGTSKRYARQDHVHPTDTTLAPKASPALTGTATAVNLTVTGTTTLATDTSIGVVTSAEIGYLDGVTSAIQTQFGTAATNLTNGLATKPTQQVGYKDTGTTAIGGNATKKLVIASPNVAGTAPNAAGYTAAEGDIWFW